MLAVLGSLALRSSYLQTKIAQYYAPKISKALGYPIEIDKVTIRFFDEATLEGVRVKDYQNHQMIDIEKLDLDFQLKSLLLHFLNFVLSLHSFGPYFIIKSNTLSV